ncbi:hypothetical protein N474_24855 [Pseudoalteromonas luteoviolacea CPMOR-2]|uniref:Uncharacterized protein n=1 Tax=Pseudoalteromonas luteoviolacea DSM 6061 TaxID=1365250 RepID=A0A166VG88_9GAMM|nr:hypothetical protein N475_21245 [Pseudoalteromonas luteoviolacea DSM 6061]KZN49110.1 hypothetical protein N474_24855 [Pseudoalteromonas luteoviolacea CPMOR-2]
MHKNYQKNKIQFTTFKAITKRLALFAIGLLQKR